MNSRTLRKLVALQRELSLLNTSKIHTKSAAIARIFHAFGLISGGKFNLAPKLAGVRFKFWNHARIRTLFDQVRSEALFK